MVRLIFLLLLLMPVMGQGSDLVVVANPKSGAESLSREQVVNIFLGRFRQFPSGLTAEPLDLPATERAYFYRKLVGKDLAEINAYWARLIFSGRTLPPEPLKSEAAVVHRVASTPGAIGYVSRAAVDKRVRIVFELGSHVSP